jgi:hypothetical protein
MDNAASFGRVISSDRNWNVMPSFLSIGGASTRSIGGSLARAGAMADANLPTRPLTAIGDTRIACFAAGTWIATTRGHVAVETVHPGDRVCVAHNGNPEEVVWVGRRAVNCTRHPEPTWVWPVRIAADAFGAGMPSVDLFLSPNHAVFVDGVLIPVRLLVNGWTVRQELRDHIVYHHIELARHEVLLANGMPVESFLDTGDQARFSYQGGIVSLHPDFSARQSDVLACAPVVQSGPALKAVRKRLTADVARRNRLDREVVWPWPTRPGQAPGPSDQW